ncbi:MAG: hypothetical protein L6R42_000769 [Xanthoria sp. 1 TBL-2021]|nr:MAG: hypothetical protein L6R42_000769 [Xanthoria sp. 1 TBL-2021]
MSWLEAAGARWCRGGWRGKTGNERPRWAEDESKTENGARVVALPRRPASRMQKSEDELTTPIIYARLYPNPKPTDPPNLQVHISKQLVPEVRQETARFYGHIDCIEAQYPGLDYAVAAHRLRLSRFPYHRRLFHVFDQLRLTDYEIQTLCKWEGTRWARERYEKDVGSSVRDTTWEGIMEARPEAPTVTRTELRGGYHLAPVAQATDQPEMNLANQDDAMENWVPDAHDERHYAPEEEEEEEEEEDEEEGEEGDEDEDEADGHSDEEVADVEPEQESEDELQQSVGMELNQRLMAATEARNRGEEAVLDADWEQWLKEAAERGGLPDPTIANAAQAIVARPSTWTQQEPLPLATAFSAPSTGQLAFNGPSTGTAM